MPLSRVFYDRYQYSMEYLIRESKKYPLIIIVRGYAEIKNGVVRYF